MANNAFHKADCITCGRKTWHFKDGDKPARCTDHSNFTPGQKRKHVADVVQGGSLYSRKELPTEREIRIANRLDRSMWRIAEQRRAADIDVSNESWAGELFSDLVERDPKKLYCSFCNAEISNQIDAMQERKPVIRKVTESFRNASGEIETREKVTSRVETKHACENCVLEIRKPIVVRRV